VAGAGLGNDQLKNNKNTAKSFFNKSSDGGDLGTLTIKFDNDMFEAKVVRVLKSETGRAYIRAVNNEGG